MFFASQYFFVKLTHIFQRTSRFQIPIFAARIDLTRARCTDVDIVVAWGDLTTEMGTAGGPRGLERKTMGKP
jgi:hypothetical protein